MFDLKRILNSLKNEKKYFTWTPRLECYNNPEETAQLSLRYVFQSGTGCKIKINKNVSIVFITVAVSAYIDAVSDGNNYSVIAGLPYTANGGAYNYGSFNFSQCAFGINLNSEPPNGMYSGKYIQVKKPRGGMDKWVASTGQAIIYGSGFYFTTE